MGASTKAPEIALTEEERRILEGYARRHTTAQALALRARIVLRCAEGGENKTIAEEMRLARGTVSRWRLRFAKLRLSGLHDEPRPGAPRKITDDKIERVVVETLESKPRGATHWSTRDMAKHSGLSHSTIGRIWRTFGLQPHRSDAFQLSNDPMFIEKVRDIVGLYLDPPESAVVLCVDEKSQVQALNRMQPVLPMMPASTEKQTHTYVRNGTTSLFAALDVSTGRVIGKCRRRHRSSEFVKFLQQIDDTVPAGLDVHVILDNLQTHKTPAAHRWFLRHPRFHVHFTPTYSSWLNQVERWFALLEQKALKRGVHRSTLELEKAIYEFIDVSNEQPVRISGRNPPMTSSPICNASAAEPSLLRACLRTSDPGH